MDLSKRLTIASVGALLAAVALLGLDVRAEAGDNFNEPRGIRWVEGPYAGIPDNPDIGRPNTLHPESARLKDTKEARSPALLVVRVGTSLPYVVVPLELRWFTLSVLPRSAR